MPNYEENFYVKGNIIGYTGSLNSNPTVYFKKGTRFGRITQAHGKQNNVGRNKVRTKADYKIYNSKSGKAKEFYGGEVKHNSRNKFHKVSFWNRKKLTSAINLFPNIKPKYKK